MPKILFQDTIKIVRIIAARERQAGEVVPVSAAHSRTRNDNEEMYGAHNAIDLDLQTKSISAAGSDGKPWFKITLDQVHCVEQVIRLFSSGNPHYTWTCSDTDCSTCEGSLCHSYTLTVYTEGAAPDNSSPASSCNYGDTVKLECTRNSFDMHEIVIIRKQGETTHYKTYYILTGVIFTLFAM